MAAGGTFTVQNKVRPGVYFRFRSKNKQDLTVGDRGIAALCEPLHWGPTAKVIEIDAGADMTVYTGYDITAPENRFLTEIFKGTNRTAAPRKVLLYRPTASGAVKATMEIAPLTATAKYVGVRGNDISVVVTALSSPEGSFEVSTVVDGEIKDQQTAKTVEELAANSWVDWSGTGALTANVGTALTGGEDGVVAASAYSAFLTAIEPYKFDVLIYDGADNTARTAMESFIKRVNTETGRYSQLVESGSTNPDTRYIVNVDTGVVLDDGTTLTPQQVCWWAGGALAAATYGQDLTNAVYPNAVDISPRLTHSQYVDAINSGKFVLNKLHREELIHMVNQIKPAHIVFGMYLFCDPVEAYAYAAAAPCGTFISVTAKVRGKIKPQSGTVTAFAAVAPAGTRTETTIIVRRMEEKPDELE